jgi:hypothetical protein
MYHKKIAYRSGGGVRTGSVPKHPFIAARRVVMNKRTGKLGSLGWIFTVPAPLIPYAQAPENSDDLTEVDVSARYMAVPPETYKPSEYEDMQEITVSGTRIPWWVWGIAGVVGAVAVNHLVKGAR